MDDVVVMVDVFYALNKPQEVKPYLWFRQHLAMLHNMDKRLETQRTQVKKCAMMKQRHTPVTMTQLSSLPVLRCLKYGHIYATHVNILHVDR